MNSSAHSVLIVTKKPLPQALAWADLARSAHEAFNLWHLYSHHDVFADFGELGNGMTGARLATNLRKKSADVAIILLVEHVEPHHRLWGQRNGANDVIERNVKAIETRLFGAPQAAAPSDFLFSPSMLQSPDTLAEFIIHRLKKYGRMGPARTLVTHDALDALTMELGTTPTIEELAHRVSKDIDLLEDRVAFLNSFGIRGT